MSANPTERIETDLQDLLERICDELRLSDAKRALAVERYLAVGKWISDESSRIGNWEPEIYAQGSLRIGTTVRPRGQNLFDLDVVCEFKKPDPRITNPATLLQALAARLDESEHYRGKFEIKRRCIRLLYSDDFYMDILVAVPDRASSTPGAILVPDREAKEWKHSNPKGYATWFEARASLSPRGLRKGIAPLFATKESVPLVMMVQLFKHWRDTQFADQPEAAISIVLTTLAGESYDGSDELAPGLDQVLGAIARKIDEADQRSSRVVVLNPANDKEDLSERWEDSKLYRKFTKRLKEFRAEWAGVLTARGTDLYDALEAVFDPEVVRRAVRKQGEALHRRREATGLGVTSSGAIVGAGQARSIPRNTFFGD